ncbi:MAG: flagellar biosynthesis anti-sigma factor FlgM, partial [Nannocystaceae bacterium]|nr:flagellar biosynthesis anti-sigma factor FlgM [Nannocystaceae bacterium]
PLTSDAERVKTAGADRPARAEGDSVKFSSSASEAAVSLSADGAAAAERVARIKADIEAGGYPIDFEKLAEKILDDELGRFL